MADRATSVKSFTLDDATIAAIDEWRSEHNVESASEALRQMVDTAVRATKGLPHPCPVCKGPMVSWEPGATCRTCRNKKGGIARHAAGR